MARAVFFCGLACSGKSTLARALEVALPAVRFSVDEHMRRHFELEVGDDGFGVRARETRELLWRKGRRALLEGRDVLFDWSLWSLARRSEWTRRVEELGHDAVVLYLDVPLGTLVRRLEARNRALPPSAHRIPVDELRRFSEVFQVPLDDEEHRVIRITPSDSVDWIASVITAST